MWEDDCVLFDRGYNDPRIIAWSIAQDSHFVIRVTVGNSKAAQDFVESGKSECEFTLTFADDLIEEFKGHGMAIPKTVRLRFVRVLLDTGEVEVLLTNLIDRDKCIGQKNSRRSTMSAGMLRRESRRQSARSRLRTGQGRA